MVLRVSRLLLLFSIGLYALGLLIGSATGGEVGGLLSLAGMFAMMIMAVVCLAVQLALSFSGRQARRG
jgi:hypothetical protein